ncbi:hypothetical protein [Microbacterium sp.]|uniref:hypothetical protein n=1 Tax=Microbacterium sp. TaxID=51671 RepID=UPI0039E48EE4
MTDPIAYWVGLAVAAFGGGFIKDFIRWMRDKRAGVIAARRSEVERAIAEKDKAVAERDAARLELREIASWWERWARILEEALGVHRRRLIDNGLPVDPYPTQPTDYR